MRFILRLLLLTDLVALLALPLCAQDLSPRAYVITPTGLNAITLTWSYFNGGVNVNGAVPITGATGIYNVSAFTYYRCFSFFGRSANVAASLPYAVGNFQGQLQQQQRSVYRSGLLDFDARFSVNLMGGPAMPSEKFAKWKQKILLGASLKVVAPTGQYDPTKLVNWGINRWAFKPEFGYSEQMGKLVGRRLRRGMVLYQQPSFVQHSRSQTTNRTTYWQSGRSFEPQLQVRHVGFVGRQLLVGWRDEPKRDTESCHQTNGLANRSHRCVALLEAPVAEGQLQRWHLHSFRRQLPHCVGSLAVLLAWLAGYALVNTLPELVPVPQLRMKPTR
jgi:Putative MetA-pathway of phenol degradation